MKRIARSDFLKLGAVSALALPTLGASPGTLYFGDGFDRDADTFPGWDQVNVRNGSATTVTDVKRRGTHALKMTVDDIDSNTFGWSGVRSHIVKNNLFREGVERYLAYSIYVPSNHASPTSWFNIGEFGYSGSYPPSNWIELRGDGHFALIDDNDFQHIVRWRSTTPLKGAWHDLIFRVYFHRSQGWVEMWVDGVAQTMANGQRRIYYPTLNPKAPSSELSHFHVCNYRDRFQMPTSTVYFDAVRVGSTYRIVDPAR